jgi:hypothetical protein
MPVEETHFAAQTILDIRYGLFFLMVGFPFHINVNTVLLFEALQPIGAKQ